MIICVYIYLTFNFGWGCALVFTGIISLCLLLEKLSKSAINKVTHCGWLSLCVVTHRSGGTRGRFNWN